MSRRRSIFLLSGGLVVGLLLFNFQNCGSLKSDSTTAGGSLKQSPDQMVVGSAKQVQKIIYDIDLESGRSYALNPEPRLEIDLNAGTLKLSLNSMQTVCDIESQRLEPLKTILSAARVCKPPPLPPDTATCMAIGLVDIQLISQNSSAYLRPNICHNGIFLCDGLDEGFREALNDLRANPPASCRLQ